MASFAKSKASTVIAYIKGDGEFIRTSDRGRSTESVGNVLVLNKETGRLTGYGGVKTGHILKEMTFSKKIN